MKAPQKMRLEITNKTLFLKEKKLFMKKEKKNKKKKTEEIKHESKQKKVFHNMKVIYEKAIGVNNNLKLNVDEQQIDLNHYKKM